MIDISTEKKDGMLNDEQLIFELWQQSSNQIFELSIDWKEGSDFYSSNGINIASTISISTKPIETLQNISLFPNPNSGQFNIEFELDTDDYVNVSVFNVLGKKVYVSRETSLFKTGLNQITVSVPSLNQGIYYVELKSSNCYRNITFDLTK